MSEAISPLPQYAFMGWSSVKMKHMDNFTFTFYEPHRNILETKGFRS
jgi:hypothetical protein